MPRIEYKDLSIVVEEKRYILTPAAQLAYFVTGELDPDKFTQEEIEHVRKNLELYLKKDPKRYFDFTLRNQRIEDIITHEDPNEENLLDDDDNDEDSSRPTEQDEDDDDF